MQDRNVTKCMVTLCIFMAFLLGDISDIVRIT